MNPRALCITTSTLSGTLHFIGQSGPLSSLSRRREPYCACCGDERHMQLGTVRTGGCPHERRQIEVERDGHLFRPAPLQISTLRGNVAYGLRVAMGLQCAIATCAVTLPLDPWCKLCQALFVHCPFIHIFSHLRTRCRHCRLRIPVGVWYLGRI